MDELIDILDSDGSPVGQTCMKSEAHQRGLWHACVHIWLYNLNGEVVIQKRIENKDTFPGLWDVSVAGHIGAGENPELAAERELSEELGIKANLGELELIGNTVTDVTHTDYLIDREYHYVYLFHYKGSINDMVIQEEEVAGVRFYSLDDWLTRIKNHKEMNAFVPYAASYLSMVRKAIDKRLSDAFI